MLNIIVNPKARKAEKLVRETDARLKEAGAEHRFFYSHKHGDAIKYAHSLTAAGQTELIALGGDGTVNEVLSGAADPARLTLGIIPAGTGNDFASAFGIPMGVKALDLILNTEPKPTDYLECGTRRSLNIAGTGIDVEILRRCERSKGSKKGRYFRSLLFTLLHYRGTKLIVSANGETREYTAMIAAACNGRQLGNGIPLCPVAEVDDGQMELIVVDCPPRGKLLPMLLKMLRGKLLELPVTHRVSCREAHISAPEGKLFVQFDGEILEEDALGVRLMGGGLRVWRG